MANPTVVSSGTQTATGGGTEDTLATVNVARVLTLVVDTTAMAVGDTITLRCKRKVLSGGALVEMYKESFSYPLDSAGLISAAMPSPHQAVFTLAQEAGTPKAFPWSVEST